MTTLLGQIMLLVVFSLALAAVASAYREDEPKRILQGILRRSLLFGGAVAALGVLALVLEHFFLPVA